MHVFARRGLGGARHSEIAKEAKVSVPTVFFYFPSREALVKAVLEEVARFLTDMTVEIHSSPEPAPDIVLAHAKAFADSVDTHPDYARVWLDWSTAMRDEIWPLYLEFQENIVVGIIANTIRRWQRSARHVGAGGGGRRAPHRRLGAHDRADEIHPLHAGKGRSFSTHSRPINSRRRPLKVFLFGMNS